MIHCYELLIMTDSVHQILSVTVRTKTVLTAIPFQQRIFVIHFLIFYIGEIMKH